MAKIALTEEEEILTFPADSILELKIEAADVEEVQGRNGPWEKVAFKFKILGIQIIGDGRSPDLFDGWVTRTIFGSVPFRLTDNPENKLRIWAEAIFRQELGVGFELDTDMFVGRSVRGITSTYDRKSRDANGNVVKRHQIETLLPFGANSGGTAAPAASAAAAPAAVQDPWAASPAGGNTWDEEPPF